MHLRTRRTPLTLLALLTATVLPLGAQAADPPVLWQLVPQNVFNDPLPGYWTTKVEIADINDDGWPDIVFANVGGYQAGTPDSFLSNQVFLSEGGTSFYDASLEVFGPDPNNPGQSVQDTARVIKAADLDGDGDTDLIVGTTWQTKSVLYLQDDLGNFEQVPLLPALDLSVGDLELGDVDGDGDLDAVLSDWGPAPVGFQNSSGGITRLWVNDGQATFTDVTSEQMPASMVNWSWDIEFADIDNDWDLDLLIACRSCATGSLLFVNDGLGNFSNATAGNLPPSTGNVDFEIMDVNGDGYVDTYSLQDGPNLRNRLLINSKNGGFTDQTGLWWEPADNPPGFDYMGAFVDYDSDGLPDIVLGAFGEYADRVMRNTGTAFKPVTEPSMMGNLITDGTYALALADFNGDTKIDLVLGEGENSFRNRVLFGEDIAPDTGFPVIGAHELLGDIEPDSTLTFHGRIHDNKTPNKPHDWTFVGLRWVTDGGSFDNPGDITSYDLQWYGEHLWRTGLDADTALVLPAFETVIEMRICATDAAENETCVGLVKQFLCGDGKVNSPNEECDGEAGCLEDCTWALECGNGIVQEGEECDDGNDIPGDGCEPDCTLTKDSETETETMTDTDNDTDNDTDATSVTDSLTDGSATMTTSASGGGGESMTAGTESDSESDSATATWGGQLDDDGCDCRTHDHRNLGTALLVLGLLGLRRRRR